MTKYVVFYSAGLCGTDMNSGIVEYDSAEKAIEDWYSTALDWTEEMQLLHGGFSEEEMEEFDPEQYVECWAEEYNPEKHDGLLL
jgi:hypothetical protein